MAMTPPPLAIVQARIGSTRLPGKMLLDLGGHPLVYWAWNAARLAFGLEHTVVAIPASAENDELASVVEGFGGRVFRWAGPENDVLGRFHACAHTYRWHPDSVIVRVTPDDPLKSVPHLIRVAAGERLPVELGGEAFTLAMLDDAHEEVQSGYVGNVFQPMTSFRRKDPDPREHLTLAIPCLADPPPAPEGCWTVDTAEDLERMRATFAKAYDAIPIEGLAGALA